MPAAEHGFPARCQERRAPEVELSSKAYRLGFSLAVSVSWFRTLLEASSSAPVGSGDTGPRPKLLKRT